MDPLLNSSPTTAPSSPLILDDGNMTNKVLLDSSILLATDTPHMIALSPPLRSLPSSSSVHSSLRSTSSSSSSTNPSASPPTNLASPPFAQQSSTPPGSVQSSCTPTGVYWESSATPIDSSNVSATPPSSSSSGGLLQQGATWNNHPHHHLEGQTLAKRIPHPSPDSASTSSLSSPALSPAVARATVTTTAIAARSPSSYVTNARPSNNTDVDNYDDDDDDTMLTEDELSIESYMRRHPCVLDRGSAFLDRHPYIYQVIVLLFTLGGVAFGSLAATAIQVSKMHFILAYSVILLDLFLFYRACRTPPGKPPLVSNEKQIIEILHEFPVSTPSIHNGLHASEWNRSWSYCESCSGWRTARTHHCSRCNSCVLMRDHHCLWIGQCVGANNYTIFSCYVGLTCLLSLEGLWITYRYLTSSFWSSAAGSSGLRIEIFLPLFIFTLGGFAASTWLSVRCLWMQFSNETHLESLKKHEVKIQLSTNAGTSSAGSKPNVLLLKEKMLRDAGNGSSAQKRSSSNSSTVGDTPAVQENKKFFSPFQCACHAGDAYRRLYCQSFNFPSLQASASPIPPLQYYYEYGNLPGTSWRINSFLFWGDIQRNCELFQWTKAGGLSNRRSQQQQHSSQQDHSPSNQLIQLSPLPDSQRGLHAKEIDAHEQESLIQRDAC